MCGVYRCGRRQASSLLAAPVNCRPKAVHLPRNTTCFDRRGIPSMKTTLSLVVATVALLVSSGSAQNPAAQNEQRLMALVQEVQAKQSQIASNQDKIDS